jgi:hypothetical protein
MKRLALLALFCLVLGVLNGCGTSDSVSTKNAAEATTEAPTEEETTTSNLEIIARNDTTIDGRDFSAILSKENGVYSIMLSGNAENNEKAYTMVTTTRTIAEKLYNKNTVQEYNILVKSDETGCWYGCRKTSETTAQFGGEEDGTTTLRYPKWLSEQDATTIIKYQDYASEILKAAKEVY